MNGLSNERLGRVDAYLRGEMERRSIPGLAVSVVHAGEMLKAEAYGVANLEWDAAATPDTAFQLASVTKLLTSTLLMVLAERGDISMAGSVREYLPDAPESWSAITVRHLASHTSGISDEAGAMASVEETVRAAYDTPLAYEPGTRVEYGLNDYVVLTHVLETAMGAPFPALLRERLTEPLGMTATRFDNVRVEGRARVSDIIPQRTAVYRWDGTTQKRFALLFQTWTYSAGGLYSSANDLGKWSAALDGSDLLSAESKWEMFTRQRLANGMAGPFAVGWIGAAHGGRTVMGHSGGPALADVARFPDEALTVSVLTNQQNLRPYLAMEVVDLLLPPM